MQYAMMALLMVMVATCAHGQDAIGAGDGYEDYTELKDMHIETVLSDGGQPQAVIVAPQDGRHGDAVAIVQRAVQAAGGCELPIVGDDEDGRALLADRSVIAIGNRHTSRFLDDLYYRYYTFLDARYPGAGGHVLRSLHDPFGTGRNVILAGGSDDDGVLAAAQRLAESLEPGDPLTVGWLMEIELGEGVNPPDLEEQIYSWRDSYRVQPDGEEIGYAPASTFGWNPISVRAALYYMTGEERYLRDFVRLALPDPDNIPDEIATDYSFTRRAWYDLAHPLVYNYHYHSHMSELCWDLIEESPLLDDETRLRITNELRGHQDFLDAEDTFAPSQGASRHALYDALSIYTGTRYFAKYYPAERWEKRLANLEKVFSWWLTEPTWGENDTLTWVNTSTEPVLEYFVLTHSDAFAESGMARTMMSALEIIWTGSPYEMSNRFQTISLMHKASHMLEDGRYAWLARQAGYDFDTFRIGQSWWPDPEMAILPPEDRIGRVSVMPLAKTEAKAVGAPFDAEQAYEVLGYRTGLGPDDGYLMVDGHNGRGRNAYHVSAIHHLRMQETLLLYGYDNQVVILRDGLAENVPPKASRLDHALGTDSVAYISTTVPNASYSEWRRDILWADERYCIVADTVTAREAGEYDVTCQWNPMPEASVSEEDPRRVQRPNMLSTIVCAEPVGMLVEGARLSQRLPVGLEAGESVTIVNALYKDSAPGAYDYTLEPLTDNVVLVKGEDEALFASGDFSAGELQFEGAGAYLGEARLALFGAASLSAGAPLFRADHPASVVWDLASGTATIETDSAGIVALPLADGAKPVAGREAVSAVKAQGLTELRLEAGRHELSGLAPAPTIAEAIDAALSRPVRETTMAAGDAPVAVDGDEWPARWRTEVGASVTELASAPEAGGGLVWVGTESPGISLLAPGGEVVRLIDLPEAPKVLAAPETPIGSGVAMLAGGDDDVLRAYSADGELLWEGESHVSSDHKNPNGGYQAPWFTDPANKWGIMSLMVADLGSGPEIVLGRPSTVEFWSPTGEVIARKAVEWGDCTELQLLHTEDGPRVLAGKFITGRDTVTVIGPDHEFIGKGWYIGVPDDSIMMAQWSQRGITTLDVTDLQGDGAPDVVVGRSGHWSDLRVYDAADAARWQRSFGPSIRANRLVRSVLIEDLDDDGSQEIVCGLANGWIIGFTAEGTHLFSINADSAVIAGAATADTAAFGLADGRVLQVDVNGRVTRVAHADSAVTTMVAGRGASTVLVGTEGGSVIALDTAK